MEITMYLILTCLAAKTDELKLNKKKEMLAIINHKVYDLVILSRNTRANGIHQKIIQSQRFKDYVNVFLNKRPLKRFIFEDQEMRNTKNICIFETVKTILFDYLVDFVNSLNGRSLNNIIEYLDTNMINYNRDTLERLINFSKNDKYSLRIHRINFHFPTKNDIEYVLDLLPDININEELSLIKDMLTVSGFFENKYVSFYDRKNDLYKTYPFKDVLAALVICHIQYFTE